MLNAFGFLPRQQLVHIQSCAQSCPDAFIWFNPKEEGQSMVLGWERKMQAGARRKNPPALLPAGVTQAQPPAPVFHKIQHFQRASSSRSPPKPVAGSGEPSAPRGAHLHLLPHVLPVRDEVVERGLGVLHVAAVLAINQ